MTLGPSVIAPPKAVSVSVAVEPALNVLNSMSMLNFAGRLSGLDEWVTRTAQALSAEDLHRNYLIISILYDATLIDDYAALEFPAYLEALAAQAPTRLRDRVIEGLLSRASGDEAPSAGQLLKDSGQFISYVQKISGAPGSQDVELLKEAHTLLNDPSAMHSLILSHLQKMWETVMVGEWARVHAMLEDAAAAFQGINLRALAFADAFRFITGRDISGELDPASVPPQVIFVPSVHIGPYITLYERGQMLRVCFGARAPVGVEGYSSQLGRSQLLVWLNALADDTRLSILELIAHNGEVCAQDIIARFNLSQSSASRHLRQLRAAGYLTERRRDGANKCYTLNPGRVEEMIAALRDLLIK